MENHAGCFLDSFRFQGFLKEALDLVYNLVHTASQSDGLEHRRRSVPTSRKRFGMTPAYKIIPARDPRGPLP